MKSPLWDGRARRLLLGPKSSACGTVAAKLSASISGSSKDSGEIDRQTFGRLEASQLGGEAATRDCSPSVLADQPPSSQLNVLRPDRSLQRCRSHRTSGKWPLSQHHARQRAGGAYRVDVFCDTSAQQWASQATVHKSNLSRLRRYGDADPSNVSPLDRGAEVRVVETRPLIGLSAGHATSASIWPRSSERNHD